jgi:transposase-like protein
MSLFDFVRRSCPYCGETLEISIEPGYGHQSYVEDCQVCCFPFVVFVDASEEGLTVELRREDGAD